MLEYKTLKLDNVLLEKGLIKSRLNDDCMLLVETGGRTIVVVMLPVSGREDYDIEIL
jgi:hypothetical protein